MRGIIKYPGSKWRLSDWILSYFPKHHSYLEPFFGSGAVFFSKQRSNIETINDLDRDVVNLFHWVKIYCDPPYLLNTRSGGEQYKREMTEDDHENLLYQLKKHKGFVLLSGYESKMYDSFLKDWHKETHINYSQVGSKKQEVLWMNFEPPAQISVFDFMAQ